MPGLTTGYSPFYLVLITAIAAAVSWYFYRNAALSRQKKILLISLKTAAITVLLALFLEPVLTLLGGPDKGRDIILVDISRSNNFSGKSDNIKSLLNTSGYLNDEGSIYGLAGGLNELPGSTDSVQFNGFNTDISASLRQLKERFPDGSYSTITLITDGIYNSGSNPVYEAEKFRAPFIIVPVGDSAVQKDIIVRRVISPVNAFTGTAVKIKVYLDIYKFPDGKLTLKLMKEGIEAKSLQLSYNEQINYYEAEFDITENEPGKFKYSVSADGLQDELTSKNNHSTFYINYFDNKVNLMVVSGGPGYDNEFTGSVLKRIGNYNITYRTLKSPDAFYEGALERGMFAELSALFLLNFPSAPVSARLLEEVSSAAKQYNIPVIFFAGKNTDYLKLASFEDLVPFTVTGINSGEKLMRIAPVSVSENPLSKITGLGSNTEIFRNVSGIIPKPGSVTLATDKSTGEPVIMHRVSSQSRSAAFLGYGLWKWKLNSSGNAEKSIEAMLLELVNMTLEKEKKAKLKIYPAKDIFDHTEHVKIFAEVYDENYILTGNASVTGKVLNKEGINAGELKFVPAENKFIAELPPLTAGDYYIECSADYNSSYWASAKNRFTSDTVNTEYLDTRTNYNMLNSLASKTGGRIIHPDSTSILGSVINELSSKAAVNNDEKRYLRFDLWGNKYYLILAVLLFSFEWILRKRNNLP